MKVELYYTHKNFKVNTKFTGETSSFISLGANINTNILNKQIFLKNILMFLTFFNFLLTNYT